MSGAVLKQNYLQTVLAWIYAEYKDGDTNAK